MLADWRFLAKLPVPSIFFTMAQQPLAGQGLLIMKDSLSYSDTPHSVGLLWTSDQPDAETSTWQHTTLTIDRHSCPPAGFQTAIIAGEWPQTDILDRAVTETDSSILKVTQIHTKCLHADTCPMTSQHEKPQIKAEKSDIVKRNNFTRKYLFWYNLYFYIKKCPNLPCPD